MDNLVNPFAPGDIVVTKFMGAEVAVPVIQVFNQEVQIRTADKVLRWRTSKTVWFPPEKDATSIVQPSPEAFGESAGSSSPVCTPDQGVPAAPVLSPDSLTLSEHPIPKGSSLGVIPPAPVDQQFITVCGQEEFEDLQRTGKAKRRTARRKR